MACEYMISKTGSTYTSFEMCLGMEMMSIHCWAVCTKSKKKSSFASLLRFLKKVMHYLTRTALIQSNPYFTFSYIFKFL